jgi:hypothetical protein
MIIRSTKRLFLISVVMFSISSCGGKSDPYEEGMHWDYSITCEGGFIYKSLDHHRGTILILNSDGTPLRCGKKRY